MHITIDIKEKQLKKLEKIAKESGRTIEKYINDWINDISKHEEEIKSDPLFSIDGFDSNAPKDLSKNIDSYIY